jgi:hypothetical protein
MEVGKTDRKEVKQEERWGENAGRKHGKEEKKGKNEKCRAIWAQFQGGKKADTQKEKLNQSKHNKYRSK